MVLAIHLDLPARIIGPAGCRNNPALARRPELRIARGDSIESLPDQAVSLVKVGDEAAADSGDIPVVLS